MTKQQLHERVLTENFELTRHNCGIKTITRWRYVDNVYTPKKHTFTKFYLTIRFEGEECEYRINKQDYKIFESLKNEKTN
jgi:hypothetical protein